jgi:hypothetical protein
LLSEHERAWLELLHGDELETELADRRYYYAPLVTPGETRVIAACAELEREADRQRECADYLLDRLAAVYAGIDRSNEALLRHHTAEEIRLGHGLMKLRAERDQARKDLARVTRERDDYAAVARDLAMKVRSR